MATMDDPNLADGSPDDAADEQAVVKAALPSVPAAGVRRTGRLQVAERTGYGIGVVWDGKTLHAAQVHAVAGQVPTLVSAQTVPVASSIAGQTETDPQQLSRVLHEVAGDRPRAQVWTALDSPTTVTQIIRVPAVEDRLLPNAALWTLRKGKSIEVEGSVLDFEVLRPIEQDGARQLELLSVAAPRTEIDALVADFRAVDYPLSGVVPRVLAFRNLLRFAWSDACRGQCVLVCVDDEDTEILLVCDGKPVGTRSVRTGMSSLRHAFAQHLDVDVMEPRVEQCMGVLRGGPLPAISPSGEPLQNAEQVFDWVRPAARRLVRNVQRALHGFEVEHGVGDGAVFLVTGRITSYPLVERFLGTQLGVHLQGLTDPARAPALAVPAASADPAVEEGHGRAVAIGLALAAAYTTGNFLFTFEDRLAERRRLRVRHACLGVAVGLLAVLLSGVGYLQMRVYQVQHECARLRASTTTAAAQPVEGASVAALMARVGAAQTRARKLAEVYFAPALISELASLTAPPVYLLGVDLRLADRAGTGPVGTLIEAAAQARTVAGRRQEARQAAGSPGEGTTDRARGPKLVIQGVLAGRHDRVDSELAAYILRLQGSPLFESPVVIEHRSEAVDPAYLAFEPRDADQVLFFTVEASYRQGSSGGTVASLVEAVTRPDLLAPKSEEGRP